MLDLSRRHRDVRALILAIENWLIATLAEFAVEAVRHDTRVGVWVPRPQKPRGLNGEIAEDKIAAIGIQIRKWVSFHGVALNICPDLSHYSGIVPCGTTGESATLSFEEHDRVIEITIEQAQKRIPVIEIGRAHV